MVKCIENKKDVNLSFFCYFMNSPMKNLMNNLTGPELSESFKKEILYEINPKSKIKNNNIINSQKVKINKINYCEKNRMINNKKKYKKNIDNFIFLFYKIN